MWEGKSLAVVLPTFREKATIRQFIRDLESLGLVDEILVVNNNAEPGTSEAVAGTSAREIHEVRQGYGASIRRGLAETGADLVAVVEPDGTFDALDIWKLLAYSRDFDFVYGSRTVPDLIWDGANMGRFLRWGNWAVAKVLESLFNTSSLSDIGCTMRLANGGALRVLQPHYTVDDGAFGPEMMLLSIIGGWRVIQVPVNYKARVGAPGTTESFRKALSIGLHMLRLIGSYRVRRTEVAGTLAAGRSLAGQFPTRSDSPSPGGEPSHMFPWLPPRKRPRVKR
jgi:glycosyltransferase involved in cell wall biosynthesis